MQGERKWSRHEENGRKRTEKAQLASLDATAATPLTDESGSEHVDGQRKSPIYAGQNLIRGGKSSVCSWRLKIRAQQVRSAAATMAARLAAVQHQHITHTLSLLFLAGQQIYTV